MTLEARPAHDGTWSVIQTDPNQHCRAMAVGLTESEARKFAAVDALVAACEKALDIMNSYKHIPAQFKACEVLQAALARVEGGGE